MNPSIGVACSMRDEENALPGFLEMASQFFDEILIVDASMDMTPSSDQSRDILRKWGLPVPPIWNLSAGFGSIRSQLVHTCPTDWVCVFDLDERINVTMPVYKCEGTDRYPAQTNPNLKVSVVQSCYNQKELLVQKIQEAERRGIRTVRFQRRHWCTADYTKPAENWNLIKDYQLRCIKARSDIGYSELPRMHERCIDRRTGQSPEYIEDDPMMGPIIEHRHLWFKAMEPEQRAADIKVYDALHHSDTHTPIPTR